MEKQRTHGWSTRRREALRKWIVRATALAALIGAIALDRAGLLLVDDHDDFSTYHGVSARVLRVESGVQLIVDLPDALHRRTHTRVRLWGVACEDDGAARRRIAEYMADGECILVLERHRTRDLGGSLLAHIERPDGESLNQALLIEGLARVDDTWPHSLLLRYDQIQRFARRNRAGMWSDD